MKIYVIAPLLGFLFPLGFAPFEIWPLTVVSLSGLLFLLVKLNYKRSFLVGLMYGLGLWSLGVSWVYVSVHFHGKQGYIVSFLITFGFIFLLSIYTGLTTYLFKILKTNKNVFNYLIVFPVIWVSIEVLRSYCLTGFPWLILGTSLSGTLFGGWTPILGSYSSSFVLLILSSCVLLLYENLKISNLYPLFLVLVILISSFTLNKINWTYEISNIKASIYQPNLTLEKKWSTQGVKHTIDLIDEAVANAEDNEFIFLPETALILEKERLEPWISILERKLNERQISIISGIIAEDTKQTNLIERYNRIQGFGYTKGHYDKVHLVPFGEYIPLRNYTGRILDIIGINLINTLPGRYFKTLNSGDIIISPSICYEVAFSDLVRRTAKISNLLVSISNDTWFGTSIGPEQHLEIAQTRALEHQKSLIRATNSGISAIISRKGKILDKQVFFEEKELKNKVKIYAGNTPFSIFGNYLIYCYIVLIYMYLLFCKATNVLKFIKRTKNGKEFE